MDAVFKALADESRRQLLDRLHAENGQTLNDLCGGLDMSRQAVTKHPEEHSGGGELSSPSSGVGAEKLHYLNPVPIFDIADRWIGKFERGRLRVLGDLKKNLEREEK